MARTLSAAAMAELFAQHTDEVFIPLLEIDEASLQSPLYFAHNTQAVVSGANTYLPVKFGLALPSEEQGTLRPITLVVDNVTKGIGDAIALAVGRPTVKLSYVLASDPDTVEAGPFLFTMESATYDAQSATASMKFSDILHQGYPEHGYQPGWTPAIF